MSFSQKATLRLPAPRQYRRLKGWTGSSGTAVTRSKSTTSPFSTSVRDASGGPLDAKRSTSSANSPSNSASKRKSHEPYVFSRSHCSICNCSHWRLGCYWLYGYSVDQIENIQLKSSDNPAFVNSHFGIRFLPPNSSNTWSDSQTSDNVPRKIDFQSIIPRIVTNVR